MRVNDAFSPPKISLSVNYSDIVPVILLCQCHILTFSESASGNRKEYLVLVLCLTSKERHLNRF